MPSDLIVVTGGSRGIGVAIAQRLLDAGAKVVVTARSRSDVASAVATFISGDVRTNEGVMAIAAVCLHLWTEETMQGPLWIELAKQAPDVFSRRSPRSERITQRR